jgi:hypothetical protein
MWIFTKYGFFSFVCPSKADGRVDSKKIVIRARSDDHLRRLQGRFPDLAAYKIISTPVGDYPYRMILSKHRWARITRELALEVDWTNFRNEVAAHQGTDGQNYLDAIHDVWDRMAHL